ncbi:MAG TPA: hypothetical protein VGV68_15440 [Terriglobia bacterium]|nr:hypothetical protein [Terriglobia bacterium]
MNHVATLSKGTLLAGLERLIKDAKRQLKCFAEGRPQYIGHVVALRNRVQHCLLDIGDGATKELRAIVNLDLTASKGLSAYYANGIFDVSQLPSGENPAEFVRLQQEYDRETPPKIERMIALMQQAKDKILGVITVPGRKPLSVRDQRLDELIGPENLRNFTNSGLRKRFQSKCTDVQLVRLRVNKQAFRCALDRLRKYHNIPAPKPTKNY